MEENAIALCALHHKLFDRGAFTVSPELRIEVSDRAHGTHGFDEWLYAFHGKSLSPPQRPNFYPEPEFVQWHVREVFQERRSMGDKMIGLTIAGSSGLLIWEFLH